MLDLVFLICHDYCLTFNWSFTRCLHNSCTRPFQEITGQQKPKKPKAKKPEWSQNGTEAESNLALKHEVNNSSGFVFNGRISRYDRITHLPSRMSKTYREWESPGHATNEKSLANATKNFAAGVDFSLANIKKPSGQNLFVTRWFFWQLSIFSGVAFGAD